MILLWISLLLIALCLLWMENLTRNRAFFGESEETGNQSRRALFARNQDHVAFSTWSHTFPDERDAQCVEVLPQRWTDFPTNPGKPKSDMAGKQAVVPRPSLTARVAFYLLHLTKDSLSEHAFLRIASRYNPLERLSLCSYSSNKST